jgi:hypothetical protein
VLVAVSALELPAVVLNPAVSPRPSPSLAPSPTPPDLTLKDSRPDMRSDLLNS